MRATCPGPSRRTRKQAPRGPPMRDSVMAGLVPAIHVLPFARRKTWMPGTRPGMTERMSHAEGAVPCKSPVFRLFYQEKAAPMPVDSQPQPCFSCLLSPDAVSFYRGAMPSASSRGARRNRASRRVRRSPKGEGGRTAAGERRACRFVVVYNEPALASRPYSPFAVSRSLNFWILPVEVLGNSANTTTRGHL